MNSDSIIKIIEKHKGGYGELISILEDIQNMYNFLPQDALKIVADKTDRPLSDVFGVATFYRAFSLKPRGKHLISVCLGTACHVRGSQIVVEEFKRQLGVEAGETTPDKEFTLETVNCLGACALGPIVVVDGHYFSNVSRKKVKQIIEKTIEGLDRVEIKTDKRIFPIEIRCPRCNHTIMDSRHLIDDYPSIRVTVSFAGKHGWLRLSSLYGSYNIESEYEIPVDALVHFFCPYCHVELMGASNCTECGAPMVPMTVQPGGMMQICSRRGCKGHLLDVGGKTLEY